MKKITYTNNINYMNLKINSNGQKQITYISLSEMKLKFIVWLHSIGGWRPEDLAGGE